MKPVDWIHRLGRAGASRRSNGLLRRVDGYCVAFHQAYENREYDARLNGEARILARLAREPWVRTVFDVGANVGDWTIAAAQALPEARIECFEISADSHDTLRRRCAHLSQVRTHALGLSDHAGDIDVFSVPGLSVLNTGVAGTLEAIHGLRPEVRRERVTTGDLFCRENNIDRVDFLKIDVEGLEWRVLAGFREMLEHQRIGLIQFEYGYVNIAVKALLKDFYDLLRPLGFSIGKLYPSTVEFRDYRFEHEDFIGPNFLAVHRSRSALTTTLR